MHEEIQYFHRNGTGSVLVFIGSGRDWEEFFFRRNGTEWDWDKSGRPVENTGILYKGVKVCRSLIFGTCWSNLSSSNLGKANLKLNVINVEK